MSLVSKIVIFHFHDCGGERVVHQQFQTILLVVDGISKCYEVYEVIAL